MLRTQAILTVGRLVSTIMILYPVPRYNSVAKLWMNILKRPVSRSSSDAPSGLRTEQTKVQMSSWHSKNSSSMDPSTHI
ncbi:hypothetical protein A3720_23370 [Sulfitobacter sp. HI0021]|nr:hypothetical protein A3720_23370 [Sulfitobacter sp. HI0021]